MSTSRQHLPTRDPSGFPSRPFSVQKIPHSNLILLVVDTLCPCGNKRLAIQAQEVVYEGACKGRNPRDNLARRRPPKCISYHPEVRQIAQLGERSGTSVGRAH